MVNKAKKPSKKSNINPDKFEHYLMIVLLVAFVLSAVVLIMRNQNSSGKTDVGEPTPVVERTEE